MKIEYSLAELEEIIGDLSSEGSFAGTVSGIAALKKASKTDLSFLGNKKYTPEVLESAAGVILLPNDFKGQPKNGQVFLRVENPSFALAKVCRAIELKLWPKPTPGIHPTAIVDRTAVVARSATVGPFCVLEAGATVGARAHLQVNVHVGKDARIGKDCWLRSNVVIGDYCSLGDRVSVFQGTVIGSDGFGYETLKGVHEKVPQIGNVVVGNNVEIGANTTIDRARFSSTVIGEGTKIDNLVQIAHNVVVGKGCLIVAQAGISGSTTLEDYVVLAGQVGVAGHLHLGKGVIIGAQSGVAHDVEAGNYLRGSPALPHLLANKVDVLRKKIPELFKRVGRLEDQLDAGRS